jgi:hypothetical protein
MICCIYRFFICVLSLLCSVYIHSMDYPPSKPTYLGSINKRTVYRSGSTLLYGTPFFDQKGGITSAFEKLLKQFDISAQSINDLRAIVAQTQNQWLFKGDRWNLLDKQYKNKDAICACLEELGFQTEMPIQEIKKKYDAILVLSDIAPSFKQRLDYLKDCFKKVPCDQVIIVSGERKLDPVIESQKELEKLFGIKAKITNEKDILPELLKTDYFDNEIRNRLSHYIPTGQSSYNRSSTEDQIKKIAAKIQRYSKILFISNQPYILYQSLIVKAYLPNHEIDSVGPVYTEDACNIARILDRIARTLYFCASV